MKTADKPVICAECDFQGKIVDGCITCEKMHRKCYKSKPDWCPLEKEEVEE